MGLMQVIRDMFVADPRAARAYALGGGVGPSFGWFGVGAHHQQVYAKYPSTRSSVYACINVRTTNISQLPLIIYRGEGKARKEVESGPAVDLFRKVNPFWTFPRWLDMTEQSMCVWGQSFSVLEGWRGRQPTELWWMRADRVKVHPHPTEYISHFTYQPLDGSQPIRFERHEVLWHRFANVDDEFSGLSPLSAARLSADTAHAAMHSNFNIFHNGLTGAGMVVPREGTTLAPDQAESVARDLEARFKGVSNAHRTAVLRFGVDIKQLSLTPKDAEYLGALEWTLEDVARAFQVPIDKVGGKRTYQNVEESERALWTDCLKPEARLIASEITEQVLPLFGKDLVAEFDFSGVDVLHEAETAQWQREEGMIKTGRKTINEVREASGDDPVPWGDVWWAPVGVMPVSSDELPTLASEQAPALPPVADDPEPEDAVVDPEMGQRSHRRDAIAYGSPEHRAIWNREIERRAPWEARVIAVTRQLMSDQEQSVVARLRQRAFTRDLDAVTNDPFDELRWIRRFREQGRPVLSGVMGEAGQLAMGDIGLGISFSVKNPRVAQLIEQQVNRYAKEVNQTTWTRVQKTVAEGVNGGESIDQIAGRIHDVYSVRRRDAEMIARTEITTASNRATMEAWQQSGVVQKKRWTSALDPRTRATHVEAHNQEVDIDADFDVGGGRGPAPGSIGLVQEDANCRCTMLAVLDAEIGGLAADTTTDSVVSVPKPPAEPRPIYAEGDLDFRDKINDEAASIMEAWEAEGAYETEDEPYWAWREYKSLDYKWINRDLRDFPDTSGALPDTETGREKLYGQFELDRDARLFRGVRSREGGRSEETFLSAEPGTMLTDHGYVSTSYDWEIAAGFAGKPKAGSHNSFILEITAPRGTQYVPIDFPGQPVEGELVLPPGSSFLVTTAGEQDDYGRTVYHAVAIPPGETADGWDASSPTLLDDAESAWQAWKDAHTYGG